MELLYTIIDIIEAAPSSKIPTTYIIAAAAVIITVIVLALALGRRKINLQNNHN